MPPKKTKLQLEYEEFYSTGTIGQEMLHLFDQKGRWRGNSSTTPNLVLGMLLRATLSKDQIEETNAEGQKTLHTSFFDSNLETSCHIDYHSIEGSINITHCKEVIAENLEECSNFYADKSQTIKINKLKVIKGNLLARDTTSLKAQALQKVEGNLHLDAIQSLSLPNLESIGKDLIISLTKELSIPKCTQIGKCLYGPSLKTIDAQNLKQVDSLELRDTPPKVVAQLIASLTQKTLDTLRKNEEELGRIKSDKLTTAIKQETLRRQVQSLEPKEMSISL
jgi:hypothetical protein